MIASSSSSRLNVTARPGGRNARTFSASILRRGSSGTACTEKRVKLKLCRWGVLSFDRDDHGKKYSGWPGCRVFAPESGVFGVLGALFLAQNAKFAFGEIAGFTGKEIGSHAGVGVRS